MNIKLLVDFPKIEEFDPQQDARRGPKPRPFLGKPSIFYHGETSEGP